MCAKCFFFRLKFRAVKYLLVATGLLLNEGLPIGRDFVELTVESFLLFEEELHASAAFAGEVRQCPL